MTRGLAEEFEPVEQTIHDRIKLPDRDDDNCAAGRSAIHSESDALTMTSKDTSESPPPTEGNQTGEVRSESMRGEGLREEVTGASPVQAYQALVTGTDSWWKLLRHELLATWGAHLPGAIGLGFRKVLWPRLFDSGESSAVWGHGVELRHPGQMQIGKEVVVDSGARLDAKGCGQGEFVLEEDVMVSQGCILSAKEGGIRFGPRSTLGAYSTVYSFDGVTIGADTMIAAHCFIGGGNYEHQGRTDIPMHRQPLPGQGVSIGEDCWIGTGVTVTDGVEIGHGSVVAAGAVVLEDVPEYTVVGGVPAQQLGSRPHDKDSAKKSS